MTPHTFRHLLLLLFLLLPAGKTFSDEPQPEEWIIDFRNPWLETPEDPPPASIPFPEEMQETLRKPVTVAFQNTPLAEAVRFLNETYNARIRLDDEESPEITFAAEDISLASALFWILDPWNLAYYTTSDEIVLTTRDKMESRLYEKFYPLPYPDDTYTLPTLFLYHAQRNSWEQMYGPGWLRVTPDKTRVRVIQNQYALEECDDIYRKIAGTSPSPTAAEKRIAEALETEVSLDYDETPVREILADIARKHPHIPMVINLPPKHPEYFTQGDEPCTVHLHGVSLHCALQHILRDTGMGFTISREVLAVPIAARAYLSPTLLPFPMWGWEWEDWEQPPPEEGTVQWPPGNLYPLDEIYSILRIHVDYRAWEHGDGNGPDFSLTHDPTLRCFIVTRPYTDVREIKAILDFIDGHPWQKSTRDEIMESDVNAYFTRGYEIPLREDESPEEFMDALKKAVRPDSWDEKNPGIVTPFGWNFFIYQTREGHAEIEKFLENKHGSRERSAAQ